MADKPSSSVQLGWQDGFKFVSQDTHAHTVTVDAPWTWVAINIEYTVRGRGLRESAVRRAIELSEERYCSIGATIGGRAEITSSFTIVEA